MASHSAVSASTRRKESCDRTPQELSCRHTQTLPGVAGALGLGAATAAAVSKTTWTRTSAGSYTSRSKWVSLILAIIIADGAPPLPMPLDTEDDARQCTLGNGTSRAPLACKDLLAHGNSPTHFLGTMRSARFALRRALRTSAPRVASVHTWAPSATCPVTRTAVSAVPSNTVLPALPFRCVALSSLSLASPHPLRCTAPQCKPYPHPPAAAQRPRRRPANLDPSAWTSGSACTLRPSLDAICVQHRHNQPTAHLTRLSHASAHQIPRSTTASGCAMLGRERRDLCTRGVVSLQDTLTDQLAGFDHRLDCRWPRLGSGLRRWPLADQL